MSIGMPQLKGFVVGKPQELNVVEFEEDADNVNEHSPLDLNATGNSLDSFGQVETLVVDIKNKRVLGGNGRLRLMKEKKWDKFIGIPVEGTDDQLRTLAITLNKTGRMSDFNYQKLVTVLQQLQHSDDDRLLALTGFPQYELEPLLAAEMQLPAADNTVPEEGPKKKQKSDKDLDARGITIQYSIHQKPIVDAAINKMRGELKDFSIVPSECMHLICKQYVEQTGNEVDFDSE